MILPDKTIRSALLRSGAVRVGVATPDMPPEDVDRQLNEWIEKGFNAGMKWIERHSLLRNDLNNILPGVKSVIVAAYPYALPDDNEVPGIAGYAHFYDYHFALKSTVEQCLKDIIEPGSYRVCVDSAPIAERFMALQAGIGIPGDNGAVIVPDVGAEVFLVEILTTLNLERNQPLTGECLHCGRCREACPTGALQDDGTVDSRKCISYLTIEHKGPWELNEALDAMDCDKAKETLFGCDECIRCCPLNRKDADRTALHTPLKIHPAMELIGKGIYPSNPKEFKNFFKGSPVLRCGWDGWYRNFTNSRYEIQN